MASSIKFLQFFRKFHQTIGIYPLQPDQKQRPPFSTKSISLICSGQFILTMAAFLVFEAKSMFDCGFALFILIASANGIVIYLILIWRLGNTLKLIENCEGFIEKREFRSQLRDQSKFFSLCTCLKILCEIFISILLIGMEHSTVAYKEIIEKIERFNEFLCFAMCTTVSLFLFTLLPYSFVKYYILNAGHDSFYLFYPTWFVLKMDSMNGS